MTSFVTLDSPLLIFACFLSINQERVKNFEGDQSAVGVHQLARPAFVRPQPIPSSSFSSTFCSSSFSSFLPAFLSFASSFLLFLNRKLSF